MCIYIYTVYKWGDVQSAQVRISYITLLLACLLCFALFVVNFLFPAFVLVSFSSKTVHCFKENSGCRIHHLEIRCLANSQQMLSKPWHRATSSGEARNLIPSHNCNGLIRWKYSDGTRLRAIRLCVEDPCHQWANGSCCSLLQLVFWREHILKFHGAQCTQLLFYIALSFISTFYLKLPKPKLNFRLCGGKRITVCVPSFW